MALPDEVASTLSSVRSFSIRPFATTQKYSAPDLDVQQAGKEMHVGRMVIGHYQKVRNQFALTMQAVDVNDDRVLWQDTLNVPAEDLVAMREQVTTKIRQGLFPALGATQPADSGTRPTNEEGYDLYLRSVALAHDGDQNREAIRMLERSVGLDPSFAPSWAALGKRYYYEEEYGPGGIGVDVSHGASPAACAASGSATWKMPNSRSSPWMPISANSSTRTWKRRPWSLRGRKADLRTSRCRTCFGTRDLKDDAEQECDAAVRLDPGNYQFRSCSSVFSVSGDVEQRARICQPRRGVRMVEQHRSA